MAKTSAGVLLYRWRDGTLQVFLVHPGGPFWQGKDLAAWSIPKGIVEPGEELLAAARREFHEETGSPIDGPFEALSPARQASGKIVHAFALEGDLDAATVHSITCSVEWPRGSGRFQQFPEVDRGAWFGLAEAFGRIVKGQMPILRELADRLLPAVSAVAPH